MTCTHATFKRKEFIASGFKYDNLIMEEASQIIEIEAIIPMLIQKKEQICSDLKRVLLIGDHHQLPPIVQNMSLKKYSNLDQSLFTRLFRLGTPHILLNKQGRSRTSLSKLYNWCYPELGNLPILNNEEFHSANSGFAFDYQLIDVQDLQGYGESEPVPYFYQNLAEAEFLVSVYQYMRLIGYPAWKIAVLTTYNGQKALIRDVIDKRCAKNPIFGRPSRVTTVDKYQGQQSDYILLSLVKTRSVGHLRDIRRLIVAMSRARLGLYIFARMALFKNCNELRPTFKLLLTHPNSLVLVPNEVWCSNSRSIKDAVPRYTKIFDLLMMSFLVSSLIKTNNSLP
jgi:intron-binding protein aquarius